MSVSVSVRVRVRERKKERKKERRFGFFHMATANSIGNLSLKLSVLGIFGILTIR